MVKTDFTCTNCTVGSGYWGAYTEARPTWLPSVQVQMNLHPTYKLVTTGHSLGGVLAQIAGAQYRANNIAIDVVCN
jgi:putative lipase involved disintegration of autophagic bodies